MGVMQAKLVRAAMDDVLLQWKGRYPGARASYLLQELVETVQHQCMPKNIRSGVATKAARLGDAS